MACLAVSIGIAKPTPLLERAPVGPVSICALIPMTLPVASSRGPPELPGLIAASVCTAPEIWKPLGAVIVRPSAEMTPVVRDPCRPNGEPIAIAGSPTLISEDDPSASGFRPPSTSCGSTFSTARSRRRVGALDLGADELLPLADAHPHRVGLLDDVLVREDEAAAVEHEARATALLLVADRRPRADLDVDDAVADLAVERRHVGHRPRRWSALARPGRRCSSSSRPARRRLARRRRTCRRAPGRRTRRPRGARRAAR